MGAAEFSLLAVTLGFSALVWWVYSPSRRGRLESYATIPLEENELAAGRRRPHAAPRRRQST